MDIQTANTLFTSGALLFAVGAAGLLNLDKIANGVADLLGW